MAKKPTKNPTSEQLGVMLKNIYESGYLDRNTMYKTSFIKGMVTGLGGVIGATIVVAFLLWLLSIVQHVPWLGRGVENVRNTLQTNQR